MLIKNETSTYIKGQEANTNIEKKPNTDRAKKVDGLEYGKWNAYQVELL